MLTEKDYKRITNCSGGFRFPEFSFEEIQSFLIKKGYEIIVHKAPYLVTFYDPDDNCRNERREMVKERILAIQPTDTLPERLDSEEADRLCFRKVFEKEIKNKLLGPSMGLIDLSASDENINGGIKHGDLCLLPIKKNL